MKLPSGSTISHTSSDDIACLRSDSVLHAEEREVRMEHIVGIIELADCFDRCNINVTQCFDLMPSNRDSEIASPTP